MPGNQASIVTMTTEAEGDAAATPPGVVLERDVRFSESMIWSLQRRYYADKGPAAWHSGEVPSYATCNTYIARSYVRVVLAYLRDARAAGILDPAKPVYIIELAAGVGRFAYQFLVKLRELLPQTSLADLEVRYVMTDFARANLEGWSQHPHLAAFARDGRLGFGTFDVDSDDKITLLGGQVLSADTVDNPVVVLANYAFDTFRVDLFRVENGALHEVTATVKSTSPAPDLADPAAVLPTLKFEYGHRVAPEPYYDDPALERVLTHYKQRIPEVTFTIPYGGLRCLGRLLQLSRQRLLLVSSDKAFTQEDELYYQEQAGMQLHGGSFSLMVNFPAIGRYFVEHGGWHVMTPRRTLTLRTIACVVGGDPAAFADARAAIREEIEHNGPGEFFELLHNDRQEHHAKSIQLFLNILRLSGYDPGLLWDHAPQLRAKAVSLPEPLQLELRLAIDRAWQNFFPGPQNLPFEIARILMALRRPHEAIRYNLISIDWYGENPATYLNMGLCYYHAEDPDEALRCFDRALVLNPHFGMAREWVARVKAEAAERILPAPVGAPPRGDSAPAGAPAGAAPKEPITSVSGPTAAAASGSASS